MTSAVVKRSTKGRKEEKKKKSLGWGWQEERKPYIERL